MQGTSSFSLADTVAASPAQLATDSVDLRAHVDPPAPLTPQQLAALHQRAVDEQKEVQLESLYATLPLGTVCTLPGVKPRRHNAARKAAFHPAWTRREVERQLREAQRAADELHEAGVEV